MLCTLNSFTADTGSVTVSTGFSLSKHKGSTSYLINIGSSVDADFSEE